MTWLRQLLEADSEGDPTEFLEALKVDLFEDEVFVFTPKGEVKNLSAGSTPLDFAYSVHTDVGHRCVGAKVNGKIVPLHYQLKSGDIVEVLTSKQERGPRATGSRSCARPARATRSAPSSSASAATTPSAAAASSSRTRCARRGLPPQRIAGSPLLADVTREMGFRKADDFYIALGQAKISSKTAVNKVMQRLKQGEAVAGDETESRLAGVLEGRDERQRRTQEASDYGIKVEGDRRRHGAAGEVLPSGARRRDRRLRLARPRDHDPPRGLQERRRAEEGSRALRPGRVERRERDLLPGRAPGGRAGTAPASSRTSRGPSPRRESTSSRPTARPSTRWSSNRFVVEVGDSDQLKAVREPPAQPRGCLRRLPGNAHGVSSARRSASSSRSGTARTAASELRARRSARSRSGRATS